jgi:hypothetical protein
MFVEHWEKAAATSRKKCGKSPEEKNWYGMFAVNERRVPVLLSRLWKIRASDPSTLQR